MTSQTPYSPLVIGVASLFQPSRDICQLLYERRAWRLSHTEVAYEICPQSVRRPFPVCHVPILMDYKAELLCSPAELLQAAFCIVDGFDPFLSVTVSAPERVFKRAEPWVELNNAWLCQLRGAICCENSPPVPSAGILSPPVSPNIELSDAWFNADVIFWKPSWGVLAKQQEGQAVVLTMRCSTAHRKGTCPKPTEKPGS